MEDASIEFDPEAENINENFYENEIIIDPNLNNEDFGDFQEIINLFENINQNNKLKDEIIEPHLDDEENYIEKNIDKDEQLLDKLKTFLLRAYKLISAHNEDNDLIDKENIEENSDSEDNDNNDEINFINILKKIIENEEEDYEMKVLVKKNKYKFNENNFIINLYEKHKINMCNNLLNMKVKIKIKINMSIRSGNTELFFDYMTINYNDGKQKLEIKPNLKCKIINSIIGKRGITYCTCEKCDRCKNRYNFPFDDLLNYLKKQNSMKNDLKFTDLYFKGSNSYKNNSNYKCSFCIDFYAKKSNIVRLFCNEAIDPEHTCQFWICKDCFFKKIRYRSIEICPNCKKFKINFSNLKSYYKWMNEKQ